MRSPVELVLRTLLTPKWRCAIIAGGPDIWQQYVAKNWASALIATNQGISQTRVPIQRRDLALEIRKREAQNDNSALYVETGGTPHGNANCYGNAWWRANDVAVGNIPRYGVPRMLGKTSRHHFLIKPSNRWRKTKATFVHHHWCEGGHEEETRNYGKK